MPDLTPRGPMPRDLTPLPDLVQGAGLTGPVRARRPVYVDLLPPCNAACPAGENIQSWLAAAREGEYERACRLLTEDNPFPAIHGRVCYHPCEDACNRAELDSVGGIRPVVARGGGAVPRLDQHAAGKVRCSLAASTGVETAADVAAYLLAGADVVMTTSALLRHGPGYAAELLAGLRAWMARKGFAAAEQARGLLSADAGHAIPGRVGYLSALDQATRTYQR